MDPTRAELDRLIRQKGHSYAAISRMLGRNPSYVQQYIRRGSPRRLEDADWRKLARFFGVAEEVMGGAARDEGHGLIAVPVLDLQASAGFGAFAASEDARTSFGFDARWLRALTSARTESLAIIRVTGDSMEPTLRAGDEVLVDSSDPGSRLTDGIFVLRSDDALMVKRIAMIPGSKRVTVVSDNPAYPSWEGIDRSTLHIVGRVIWLGRTV